MLNICSIGYARENISTLPVGTYASRYALMEKKLLMCDFLHSGCEAVKEPKEFVADWTRTKGNPCLVCDIDHSECRFYKTLVNSGAMAKNQN